MKYFLCLAFVLTLTACGDKSPQEVSDEMVDGATLDEMSFDDIVDIEGSGGEPVVFKTSAGNEIIVNDLQDRQMIESPLMLTGKAPRNWFFEGSFPVTLMTLEEEIIKEWYAQGDWLDPLEEGGDLAAGDMIEFTTTLEFEVPVDGDMGKIRFAKDLVADEDTEDVTEVMILWP